METRYSSRILANVGITGTDWRLARVFGSLMNVLQIERLTVKESPNQSDHSTPRNSPSRKPANEAVATAQNRDWYKKFGSPMLSRVRDSLIKQGVLIEESVKDDDGKTRKTGRVCLAKDDQE